MVVVYALFSRLDYEGVTMCIVVGCPGQRRKQGKRGARRHHTMTFDNASKNWHLVKTRRFRRSIPRSGPLY